MDDREILTIEQVAELLQMNYYTVYRKVASGEIPASKIGRSWRVLKKDVLKYVEKLKTKK
ncbi:Helix-turn-helix domain protein [Pelotomaculum sp. FP]|uniref:helix-turn-helix domain-containing protein n=1 Tax=Pelotomaculum sp. FP TaxID=261474 RepID=UPI00106544EA|nr:helix-turn-helix domain-containing protein [Pelotomaculum sp. FP]TEB11010.1 Helix-turn-helix domain protein [Pelotomaculum sp. FP]